MRHRVTSHFNWTLLHSNAARQCILYAGNPNLATTGVWERTVVEEVYEFIVNKRNFRTRLINSLVRVRYNRVCVFPMTLKLRIPAWGSEKCRRMNIIKHN